MTESGPTTDHSLTRPSAPSVRRRARFARWAFLYALAVVYVSVVLGPIGMNFVPRDPAAAWHMLLAAPYLAGGSDQRPDWVANLLMAIPLGFLLTGALWPRRGSIRRGAAAGAALIGCVAFVVAVKYAQLFFPPRAVSLNYILRKHSGRSWGFRCFCCRTTIWMRCGETWPAAVDAR